MKTASLPRLFTYSAGALLLAAALGLFISVWSGSGLSHPHDPLFGMSQPEFFWIVGGLEFIIALICIFGKRVFLQANLVLWLAMNFVVYQAGLWMMDVSGGFNGYLGDVGATFGIPVSLADLMLKILVAYLLSGGLLALLCTWIKQESGESQGDTEGHLKTSCSACGGHIQFATQNVGQMISCPHCQKAFTLRKPDLLKMSCFFCKEHIEFPYHAIGEKMPCPHCNMDITLKEPA